MGEAAAGAKRVLLVEDEADLRTLLADALTQSGFAVETAADGVEALRAVAKARPDLVVMDLMLPVYGGFEVLRRMQQGELSGLPVVVITGRYTDPTMEELVRREPNVKGFLGKPVEADRLAGLLRSILGTGAKA